MAADVEMHLLATCILTVYAVIITIAAEVVVHEYDALTSTSSGDSVLFSLSHTIDIVTLVLVYCLFSCTIINMNMKHQDYLNL